MTDYLGRLAARSLDAGKVILPRLPGLFEPGTYGQFMERPTAFEEFEASRPNMAETMAETGQASADHGLKKMPEGQDFEASPGLKPSVKLGYSKPERWTEQDEPHVKVADEIGPTGLKAQVHQRKHRVDVAVSVYRDRDVKETMGSQIASPGVEHQVKPQAFDIASERRLQGPLKNAPATALYAGPLPRTQNQLISTTKTIPTIKVNIGRIEVRAVAQPLPPKPVSAKTSPKLSLEEYTKRSRGGRA